MATLLQEVEIQVKKLYCISKATPNLPISVDDAARSEEDVVKAKAVGFFLSIHTLPLITANNHVSLELSL